MSTASDLDLDLENLFQPAWAQAKTESNRFEKFTGNEGVKPERRFSDKPGERRGPRRDGPGGGGERRGGDRRPARSGGSRFGGRGFPAQPTGEMIAANVSPGPRAAAGNQCVIFAG
jgi:hypothetical protein